MNEDPPSLAAVPRAAAVAGVVFALLFGAALLTVRMSIPGSIAERGGWLWCNIGKGSSKRIICRPL